MPRTITVTFNDGSSVQYANTPDSVTPEQVQERAAKEYTGKRIVEIDGGGKLEAVSPSSSHEPTIGSEAARVADYGLRGGALSPLTLVDLGTTGLEWLGKKAYPDLLLPREEIGIPESTYQRALDRTGGELRRPETIPGKFAGEAVQGAVGGLIGPGGITQPFRNLAIGGMTGAGGELADLLVDKDKSNPYVRLLGALTAGGATAAGTSFVKNSDTLLRDATHGVSDEAFDVARANRQVFDDAGIPSINSQFLGPASTLDDVVATMASHQAIRPKLMTHLQDLPEKGKNLLQELINRNLPVNILNRRGTLSDIQQKADDIIRTEEQAANTAYASQLRPGVDREVVDMLDIDALRQQLLNAADNPSFAGMNTPAGDQIRAYVNKYLPELEPGAVREKGTLNSLVKTLNETAPQEGYGATAVNKIGEILRQFTDEGYGAARAAKSQHYEDVVNPLKQSVIGDIARTGGGVKPDKLAFNKAIIDRTFPTTEKTALDQELIARKFGPEAVGQILREHFDIALNKAYKEFAKDADQFQFPLQALKNAMGTEIQVENVKKALEIASRGTGQNPQAVTAGFFKVVDALKTLKDLKVSAGVSPASVEQTAGKNLTSLAVAPQSRLGRVRWDIVSKKTYEEVFDMLTTPEGIDTIQKIARSKDPNAAQVFVRSVFSSVADEMAAELDNKE